MDLQEVEWEGTNWIDLAQERERWWALVNVVEMNTSVPHNSGNFLTRSGPVSFSGRTATWIVD